MADVIQMTDQVVFLKGAATWQQPLEQAIDVSAYAQLDLLLCVHGLDAPAPRLPLKRGLLQLPALSGSGALPVMRPTELATSWDRLGGRGE